MYLTLEQGVVLHLNKPQIPLHKDVKLCAKFGLITSTVLRKKMKS